MRTVANNKMKLMGHVGMLPPVQQSRLEQQKELSNGWTPVWCGDGDGYEYQVQSWEGTVGVHLSNGTCHCRFWQLTGMPCKHVVAACAFKNERPENYCHAWLTMGAYRSTYEFYVQPTRSQQYWETTDYVRPLPPKVPKRKAGRPKRKRRRDATEQQVAGSSRTRVRRTYPDITCTRCGLTNHNARGCHSQGVSRRPMNWVPPPPEETENGEAQQTNNVAAQPGLQTEIDLSQSAPNELDLSQPTQPAAQRTSNTPVDPIPTPAARGGRGRRSSTNEIDLSQPTQPTDQGTSNARGGRGRRNSTTGTRGGGRVRRSTRGGRGGRRASTETPEVIPQPFAEAPPLGSQPTPIPPRPAAPTAPTPRLAPNPGPAPIGYVIWPNAPTAISNRPTGIVYRPTPTAPGGGYRPPPIRAPMFKPPRQSNPTPHQVQPNSKLGAYLHQVQLIMTSMEAL